MSSKIPRRSTTSSPKNCATITASIGAPAATATTFTGIWAMSTTQNQALSRPASALGNIKDHVFSYSPSWLSKQKIKELTSTNKNLQKRVEKSEATQSGELAPETQKAAETLKESIRDIADPRQQAKTQYPLSAILMWRCLRALPGTRAP